MRATYVSALTLMRSPVVKRQTLPRAPAGCPCAPQLVPCAVRVLLDPLLERGVGHGIQPPRRASCTGFRGHLPRRVVAVEDLLDTGQADAEQVRERPLGALVTLVGVENFLASMGRVWCHAVAGRKATENNPELWRVCSHWQSNTSLLCSRSVRVSAP
jgi:hypothetical protein